MGRNRLSSVLGLSLAHGQLRASHVVRTKRGLQTVKSTAATLALDLLHPDTELIGREIRNHLESAGIRERRCVVAVPANWLMSQQTRVPDLAPADADSFLQIEAEKGFPCDPEQLQIGRSEYKSGEAKYVTQLAVRREQVEHLAAALKSAGLKPFSFSLGLAALPGVIAPAGAGRITLRLEPAGGTLLISVGGGIAAFRTFEATITSEAGENLINGSALAREVRITFEQVPSDLRHEVRELLLTGDAAMARQMAETLGDWARDAGLTLAVDKAGPDVADQVAAQLARHCLTDGPPTLEFLPPRPGRWTRLMSRYSSKRLATAGFAAAAIAVIGLGFFGWQEYLRWSLRSEWHAMEARVAELETVQARIREYRSWYDSGFRNLTVLRRVTECFPENGSVTAKSFEIHGPANVSISGTARDNTALLRTTDELRKTREVQGLKIEQIRGKVPAQFTFTFRWSASPGP